MKQPGIIIRDDLRIDGIGSKLAPEIYIRDADNNQFYALHPAEWKSSHQVILEEWPTTELWAEILNMFGIHGEYLFCTYVQKIFNSGILGTQSIRIQTLLKSYGYSEARFSDIIYTASLTGYKKRLFLEKNIPVKLLRLTDLISETLCDDLSRFLLVKEVNGNIAREILNSWIDLSDEIKKLVIDKFENVLRNYEENKKINISDEYRNIMFMIRYPELNAWMSQIEMFTNDLPKNIKLIYDPKFEQNKLRIYTDLEDRDDLTAFIKSINDNDNIIILEQMINLLNHA